MQIVYQGPHEGVRVALGDGREPYARNGEPIDLPVALATRLLEQSTNWKRAPKPERPASTKARKEK
ncbi:MAG: hypothetical protein IT175_06145 [Acidobacteria bacterium]|nr:hypothetical protein [Acidobacteriota bacterium]